MKQDQTSRILFRSLHRKYTGCDCVPVELLRLSSYAIPQAVVKEFMYNHMVLPLLVYKTSQRRLYLKNVLHPEK